MALGADQVNTEINHINELTNKNHDFIGLLIKEVSRFKVE